MRRYTESDKSTLGGIMQTSLSHHPPVFPSAEAPASIQDPNYQLSANTSSRYEDEFPNIRGLDPKTLPHGWPGESNYSFPGSRMVPNVHGVHQTGSPGNASASTAHGEERDPFLNLLEQMAENERQAHSEGGGGSSGGGGGAGGELDFLANFGGGN